MSLTSYRAAPPRVKGEDRVEVFVWVCMGCPVGRPGSDLLSRVLRRSTIGAEGFHGRVRDGIGCGPLAVATRSSERTGGVGMDDRFLCEGSSVLLWCARAGLTAVREVLDQAGRAI